MVTITLNPTQSVYVNNGSKTTNYDDKDCLRVGVGSSTSIQYHTLLEFPLEQVAGAVTSATLRLYSYSDGCWQASVTQLVRQAVGEWDETAVTWNTKPDTDDTIQASKSVSGYDKWYEWDVTKLVQAQKAGDNFGLTVLQSGTTTSKAKCYKRTGTYAPQLVVEFVPLTFNGDDVLSLTFNGQAVTSLFFNENKIF